MKKRIFSTAIVLGLLLSLLALPAGAAGCPVSVDYNLRGMGVSAELTSEKVALDAKPKSVPDVVALAGRVFLGWSLTDPATLKDGEEPQLVDPATVRVTGNTTFYAVYQEADNRHRNYVIGFPDGTFRPEANITRAQVATIIARAVLTGFEEGSDYGNPGNYTDVSGHWAESAIAYCSKFGVFTGYTDDTFRPNQPITRQELAVVVARLDGVEEAAETLPFADEAKVSAWARDGIHTAYTRGLVEGYEDGTFKPQDNIQRAETVTIFNRYLKRGVNEKGLSDLTPYLYGEAFGGGEDHYMTWPDVEKGRWYYYEVIEAANDHEFYYAGEDGKSLPEHWTRCWIDSERPSST